MLNEKGLLNFYNNAYEDIIFNGYQSEIDYILNIPALKDQDNTTFLNEYIYVVLNAGMKEQIARKIYIKFMESKDLQTIGHKGKRAAICRGIAEYKDWFKILQNSEDPIEYLESLPWIGPITKYHLARNIGIDTVKPDRHLVRLSQNFGFPSPLEMCQNIQNHIKKPLGVIDVILWRYCNLHGSI